MPPPSDTSGSGSESGGALTAVEASSPLDLTRRTSSFYRPELDVLRFFAFLSVFVYHASDSFGSEIFPAIPSQLANFLRVISRAGRFGVCLFFLLSAYLITELLLREKRSTGTVHLRAFYVRRILRIWPLYFAVLGLSYLLGRVRPAAFWSADRLLTYIFLVGNLYAARYGFSGSPGAPLWSISVEEQFYLIWPTLAKCGTRWLTVACVILIPLSYVAIGLVARNSGPDFRIWASSIVQFQFFCLGALTALNLRGNVPSLRTELRGLICLGGLALWFFASRILGTVDVYVSTPSPARNMLLYGLVALGCVLFCFGTLGLAERWLPKTLVYLGKISYGLYVFHAWAIRASWSLAGHAQRLLGMKSVPAAALVGLLKGIVALALTVILAHLSYRFLETPFLRIKQRFTFVRSRAV